MTSLDGPGAATRSTPRAGARPSSLGVRALAQLHRLAEAGWAGTAVGGWAFLQASVVPGPVDIVLVPLGLADPERAWRFAWSAVVGSVLGAVVAYLIGAAAFDSVGQLILGWIGASAPEVEQRRALFKEKGLWIVLLSTMTPLSVKLVAIAAGAFGIPVVPFLLTILLGRGIRFAVVASVVRYVGDRAERYVERRYGRTLDDLAREGEAAGAAGPRS
jgi:membrane protein YqaA with SNARE-associated domain